METQYTWQVRPQVRPQASRPHQPQVPTSVHIRPTGPHTNSEHSLARVVRQQHLDILLILNGGVVIAELLIQRELGPESSQLADLLGR